MIVEVWLTVIFIITLILCGLWIVVGRPLVARLQAESEAEERHKLQAQEEKLAREAALKEIERDCYVPPVFNTEDSNVRVQEIKKKC